MLRASLLFLAVLFWLASPAAVLAWSGAHKAYCPEELDCVAADNWQQRRNIAYSEPTYHTCFDNKPDCPARLAAKYNIKKYFVNGQNDMLLLSIAAHEIQDANCPAHWYPMRQLLGQFISPLAPGWVMTIEDQVDRKGTAPDWNIPITYKGQIFNINEAYMQEKLSKEVLATIAREPSESLDEIERQLAKQKLGIKLRFNREILEIVSFPLFLLSAFYIGKKIIRKEPKISTDGLIIIVTFVVVLILWLFSYILY